MDDSAPVIEHTLTESTSNHSAGRINLNIHGGMAATVFDRMIAEHARLSQAKKQQIRGRGKVN
jgi:hypothetical protein